MIKEFDNNAVIEIKNNGNGYATKHFIAEKLSGVWPTDVELIYACDHHPYGGHVVADEGDRKYLEVYID